MLVNIVKISKLEALAIDFRIMIGKKGVISETLAMEQDSYGFITYSLPTRIGVSASWGTTNRSHYTHPTMMPAQRAKWTQASEYTNTLTERDLIGWMDIVRSAAINVVSFGHIGMRINTGRGEEYIEIINMQRTNGMLYVEVSLGDKFMYIPNHTLSEQFRLQSRSDTLPRPRYSRGITYTRL